MKLKSNKELAEMSDFDLEQERIEVQLAMEKEGETEELLTYFDKIEKFLALI